MGYNWQNGATIVGWELDFNAFNLNGSRSAVSPVPTLPLQRFTITTATATDWLFTARGRLGWAVAPSYLVYVTGRLAVTDLKVSNAFVDTFRPGTNIGGLQPQLDQSGLGGRWRPRPGARRKALSLAVALEG